ncbi:MAG: hypothetical protein V3U26_05115 [Dehalococcoidia bacterium]
MAVLRSPNDMLAAAREHMLGGRDPQCYRDWQLVMNFLAANVLPESAVPACKVIALIYDMPLCEQEIEEIVAFQLARKE